jgi:nucleoside triphosphate pyrophosphatase
MNLNYRLILASNSPRRQLLLKELVLDFEVVTQEVDESYPTAIQASEVAEYIAIKKASAYALKKGELIITADTVVIAENTILGKPKDEKQAIATLEKLSDKTHIVTTGVCIRTINKQISFSQNTEVTFDKITTEEIKYYVSKYQPLDKAGSYAIQEWIGMIGIKSINGDYYNVVGLPLQTLWASLKAFK